MARAETIESVGEPVGGRGGGGGGGGGGNGPVHCYDCRMEVPRPLHTWPCLRNTTTATTTTTGFGPVHLHPNHHLHPFRALYLSYSLPSHHPEAEEEEEEEEEEPRRTALSPSSTPPPPPPMPPRHRRNEGSGDGVSGEQPGSDREERREASRRHGPLPDLLPQNEHPSWAAPHHNHHHHHHQHHHQAPTGEAALEADIMRVANQLRTIGDEFNSTVIRRVRLAPRWQDWRDVCRGLVNFLAQTLSPLYRLT
ncbi:uncharacterized protein LOC125014094 [Mugil cephalus]|uniref:uncharacterized protein LOC125014094 n=1 Tax=Mugil cephalus TaxID=48193 RepID=UPI001FB5B775|nr:uncharacterized protein LOC125014094 [Mugil cephalus]